LFEEGENGERFVANLTPLLKDQNGFTREIPLLGKGIRNYILYFPLYNDVQSLKIALDEDAEVGQGRVHRDILPILYYGSSITEGGCASRPGNSYQAILTRRLDVDHINLGFSGNGRGEQTMARYIAGLDMGVFVLDYDYNCLSIDHLWQTHKPFYQTIRQVNPDLPIIMISSPTVIKEPHKFEERRRAVRATYEYALENGDKNVYFIDGGELFAGECWDSCTVDGVHPNDFGFFRMAMRIEKELKPILEAMTDDHAL
jgi:lysophospholipase L1-like esterase